jgi:hypothetical protein
MVAPDQPPTGPHKPPSFPSNSSRTAPPIVFKNLNTIHCDNFPLRQPSQSDEHQSDEHLQSVGPSQQSDELLQQSEEPSQPADESLQPSVETETTDTLVLFYPVYAIGSQCPSVYPDYRNLRTLGPMYPWLSLFACRTRREELQSGGA